MEKITRDNLLGNIDALIEKEKNLTEKKYDYKVNRAWPGLMKISDIETPESLVKAYEVIDKEAESHMKAIEALGLDELGLVEDTDNGKTFFVGPFVDENGNKESTEEVRKKLKENAD